MDLELDGKIAVVTGGARGIGASIARRLAAEKAKVIVLDRNKAEAERLCGEVRGLEAYSVDLTESAKVGPVITAIIQRFGRVDILVNNAGANDSAGLTSPLAHFRASLETNLVQCFYLVQLCRETLMSSRGTIVNVGSKVAVTGQGGTSGYAASKGALHALTREWALELAPQGVRVNAIVPAEVRTPLYERWLNDHEDPAKAREQIERLIPLGHRLTHPEEIADAVAFVASPRASHLTGQLIFVDGGYTHLDHAGSGST
ncbi:MAG TPA: SDR family oxidoreductase [Opitutaceae bacterium]